MSMGESLLNAAKDVVMMTENIKRLDAQINRIADDMRSIDRRLMKIELMIDLAKQPSPARKRNPKQLPEGRN